MSHPFGVDVWGTQAWRDQALAWLDQHLAGTGISRTGDAEQPHLRPWATALRIPTIDGHVWLKATAPGTAFEVRLYTLLQEVIPDTILTPLAIDTERGWIVLPDGGQTVGDRIAAGEIDEVEAFLAILPRYAEFQRALAPHADRMIELGVADMRANVLPDRFTEAVAIADTWTQRSGSADDRDLLARIRALEPTVRTWCQQLAAAPGTPILDHSDPHPWNVFVGGNSTGPSPYDWGDSVIAHPFVSMLVPLTFVRSRLKTTGDDPRVLRVRDTYLGAFGDLAPHQELVATLELACRFGHIARALIWTRAIGASEDAVMYAAQPLRNLGYLLDNSYLGAHSIWSGL